jgi:GNAT superfamily N-acetyltransferase
MESRYRRFFTHKQTLTPADLQYLTEFDSVNHLAIGAFERNEAGIDGAVVGVARFICSPHRGDRAEFALVVSDNHQGQGLGRLLLERLLAAAAERGVTGFQGWLLAENTRMQRLIQRVCKDPQFSRDADMLSVALAVPAWHEVTLAVRRNVPYSGLTVFLAAGGLLAWTRFGATIWRGVLASYELGLTLLLPSPSAAVSADTLPVPGV